MNPFQFQLSLVFVLMKQYFLEVVSVNLFTWKVCGLAKIMIVMIYVWVFWWVLDYRCCRYWENQSNCFRCSLLLELIGDFNCWQLPRTSITLRYNWLHLTYSFKYSWKQCEIFVKLECCQFPWQIMLSKYLSQLIINIKPCPLSISCLNHNYVIIYTSIYMYIEQMSFEGWSSVFSATNCSFRLLRRSWC